MARSKKSKSKSKPGPRANRNSSSMNHSPPYEAPPSSPMPYMIPPIATLTPSLECHGSPLSQEFPLSCARNEPGTKPLVEPFLIPSPSSKRGKEFRSAKVVQDPESENMPSNSSLIHQAVEKAKVKRKKIQVPTSSRILRPRGYQPSVKQELLDGSTSLSVMRLIQEKVNDDWEIPDWKASWNKWNHIRGTIRRPK